MTYPIKFRQHILAIKKKENLTFAQTAVRFGVGIATVMRWDKCLQHVLKRHKPPTKIKDEHLIKDLEQWPDAYVYERARRLGVSTSGVFHALKRLGSTYKKNSHTSKSRRTVQRSIPIKAQTA